MYIYIYGFFTGWWFQPVWKILVSYSQLGLFPMYRKNVPNHQPVHIVILVYCRGWPLDGFRSEAKFRSASAPASSSAAFAFGVFFFPACPSQEEVNKNGIMWINIGYWNNNGWGGIHMDSDGVILGEWWMNMG